MLCPPPPPISYIMFMNESLNCEFSVEMSLNFELAELVTLYYAADYFVEYSLVWIIERSWLVNLFLYFILEKYQFLPIFFLNFQFSSNCTQVPVGKFLFEN